MRRWKTFATRLRTRGEACSRRECVSIRTTLVHTAHVTTDVINKYSWNTVTYPPYSPEVPPSDYHLFPELKKHLGGTHLKTEELKEEVLSGAAGEFYDPDIKKMAHCMQKCIDLNVLTR
ncbi:hypothetical protein Trydic_g20788 [Trypoxylus dichotomus]